MRAVQPMFDEPLAGGALALGDFVFVMREHQILAAEMQIEGRPEDFHAHGAALDVPAGPAFAPRAWPEHAAVLRYARLPQREIGHGFLRVIVALHALTHAHFFEI